jgi:hypothetical protein
LLLGEQALTLAALQFFAADPGNIRYRQIVEDKKLEYFTSTRREKGAMAREIVRAWRDQNPPGRFLIKDELVTGLWEDVGDKKAREKISQALREKGPEFRRQNDMDDTSKPNKPRIGEVVSKQHSSISFSFIHFVGPLVYLLICQKIIFADSKNIRKRQSLLLRNTPEII